MATKKTTPKAKQPSKDVKAQLGDLKGRMCRWPHGDPQNDDFHFCGKKTDDLDTPYCPNHQDTAHRNGNKPAGNAAA